jgi:glycosyltransferase involved in cell wall biosynthesis
MYARCRVLTEYGWTVLSFLRLQSPAQRLLPLLLKLAVSILCENPARPTGLSTLYRELVAQGLRLFPDVRWLIFAGPNQQWAVTDPRVEVVREFPANDKLVARLWADHFRVSAVAARHGAMALLATGFVPLRAKLPVIMQVVTLHHLRPELGGGRMRRFYRSWATASGLRRARLVIVNSQTTADRLLSGYGARRERLIVSPEGLDHSRFHPRAEPGEGESLQRRLGVAGSAVLWISNLYPYKRAELLVAAYAGLSAELRAKHPLVFVGGDWANGKVRTREAARARGVERDVQFLDWVDESWLPALYRQAALHAMPSAEETFGRTTIEAMACGCPCVLSDIPVFRELAIGAAELVNFRDVPAATRALERLLVDSTYAAVLREKGTRRAAEFSFERLARERVAAILECCRPA